MKKKLKTKSKPRKREPQNKTVATPEGPVSYRDEEGGAPVRLTLEQIANSIKGKQ